MTKNVIHKNYAFEFYRLLFACAIFIMHMEEYRNYDPPKGMFSGGYLGVEFFFILSGFLMMAKNDRDRMAAVQEGAGEKLAVRYLLSRYQRLMPHYWLAIGLHLLICALLYPKFDFKKTLLRGFNDILALQTFWRPGNIDSVYWFVSALLWASALVYYLLLKKRNFCMYVAFPLGLLIFMGWLYRGYGGISVYNDDKFFMGTFWRAFFELAFGCVLYQIYMKIRHYKWNPVAMTFLEVGVLSVIIITMWFTYLDYTDFIMVFVIGALVLITALNAGYLTKFLNHKVFAGCGAISYALYLNHRTFQLIAFQFPGRPFWPVVAVSLFVSITYSAVVTALLQWCGKRLRIRHTK